MTFDKFMAQAWQDHAEDASGVSLRLPEGLRLIGEEAQWLQMLNLAQHVHGEHLGDWPGGLAALDRLAALPAFDADGASGQALARAIAGLRLSAGTEGALDGLSVSDSVRVQAVAAANLARLDTARAGRLLRDALAQGADLPRDDPMNRALAVTGNNLAATLEEVPDRSPAESELMLLAARTARRYWEIAGTWLETERAEYRLANCYLAAGDAPQARVHAQACLDIVVANEGAALERFFACEALALAERAAGDATARARGVARAREAFDALDEADKAWCAESLDRL